MGMRLIQSGGCKVETTLTKDLPDHITSHEDFVLLQLQGLNLENGNLLSETGKTVQCPQQTAQ